MISSVLKQQVMVFIFALNSSDNPISGVLNQQNSMPKDIHALSHIPTLIDLISPRPDLLHDLQCFSGCAKYTYRSHVIDHSAVQPLILWRRETSRDTEGEDHGSETGVGWECSQEVRHMLNGASNFGTRRLPTGDDDLKVCECGVEPNHIVGRKSRGLLMSG